ncbi:hypothetical protein BaRGS_00024494 [Batillaria attramentaria]|uniref:Uncharacterized protein n=1 Tax=Batillaria attramentaria TaxID=370345 RepID=A0ABD0KB14_9CAEN
MIPGGHTYIVFLGLLLCVGLYVGYKLRFDYYVKKTKTERVWRSVASLVQQLHAGYSPPAKKTPAEAKKKSILVLFSTWIDLPDKRRIYDNSFRMWRVWKPDILPLLYSEQESERKRAQTFGWETLTPPTTACGGVPILRDMFQVAMAKYPDSLFYGFSNGDLLFGAGLHETMKVLSRDPMVHDKPMLVILRRFNVDFVNRSDVHSLQEIVETRKDAKGVTDGSSDAFFTNRLFPWNRIPDIVPGRLGVAMILVSAARTLNVTVIDISPTVIALHMTTKKGNLESWGHSHSFCNRQLVQDIGMKPSGWGCGSVFCASLTSERTEGENAVTRIVKKSKPLPGQCLNCKQNMTYFQTGKPPGA